MLAQISDEIAEEKKYLREVWLFSEKISIRVKIPTSHQTILAAIIEQNPYSRLNKILIKVMCK